MMKCFQVKKLLSSYQDKELSIPMQESVESHLRRCVHCREELALLETVTRRFKKLPEIDPSLNFNAGIMARIDTPKPERFWKMPSFVYTSIFIVFFIIGYLFHSLPPESKPDPSRNGNVYEVFLQSQNLALINIQENTLAWVTEGDNHE